jgi:Outer membrane protein beta-barrel domain
MKKRPFLLILVFLFLTPMIFAQSEDSVKISFAVFGGLNIQKINGQDLAGGKLDNDFIIGYHTGINAQIPFMTQFCFQPGLVFTIKGTEWPSESIDRLSYIELPLNIVYKPALKKGHILAGIGVQVGCAVSGKTIDENGLKSDIIFTKFVAVGDDLSRSYYRHFDGGTNFFAGYELANGIFCHFNAQIGGFRINPEDRNSTYFNTRWKNMGFGLSVGYRFNRS